MIYLNERVSRLSFKIDEAATCMGGRTLWVLAELATTHIAVTSDHQTYLRLGAEQLAGNQHRAIEDHGQRSVYQGLPHPSLWRATTQVSRRTVESKERGGSKV